MKVNCNFLPREYSAFLLDTRAATVSVLLWIVSALVWGTTIRAEIVKGREAQHQVTRWKAQKQDVQNAIAAQTYPQDRIRRLIEKFTFIREAMGQIPRPYLRFYHELERAIPRARDGQRGVYIVRLVPLGSGWDYELEGEARSLYDAMRFEAQLAASTYEGHANFREPKLVEQFRIPDKKGYRFKIRFSFVESF